MSDEGLIKIAEASKSAGDLSTTLAVIRTIEAEKRTHLAELRTGIGILTIPMSLLTILIATSEYYMVDQVLSFIVGLVLGIIGLSLVGGYLVIDALGDLRRNAALRRDACVDTECLLRDNGLLRE
ncbi:MAG: hypothetical protein ACFFED_00150 [Candidatus Thorarchaeota archaeon]